MNSGWPFQHTRTKVGARMVTAKAKWQGQRGQTRPHSPEARLPPLALLRGALFCTAQAGMLSPWNATRMQACCRHFEAKDVHKKSNFISAWFPPVRAGILKTVPCFIPIAPQD